MLSYQLNNSLSGNLNTFSYPLKVVSRYRDPQLQACGNYSYFLYSRHSNFAIFIDQTKHSLYKIMRYVYPLTAKVSYLNSHPLEGESDYRNPQLVGANISKSLCLNTLWFSLLTL